MLYPAELRVHGFAICEATGNMLDSMGLVKTCWGKKRLKKGALIRRKSQKKTVGDPTVFLLAAEREGFEPSVDG
jgi:hypothetical protein